MYETILIPLDGSKLAEVALPYIEELVSKVTPALEVKVTLFHAVSPVAYQIIPETGSAPMHYTVAEMEQTKKKATEYLDKVSEGLRSKGAVVESKVGVGDAADEIIKAADEINAGFVAMSTHGRSGLVRWAFGSVADRVLRGGNRPVILVRAQREIKKT